MKITINHREVEAHEGQRLLDAARKEHSHIGYFCGGNGICQTCYVKVLEGADKLSAPGEPEKAMLSDQLLGEGYRMACLATIEKPGRIELLSAVEEVKEMTLERPLELPLYQARMGWEALVKFPATIAMQFSRAVQGRLDPVELVSDIAQAVGEALQMTFAALFPQPAPTQERTTEMLAREAIARQGYCDGRHPQREPLRKEAPASATPSNGVHA